MARKRQNHRTRSAICIDAGASNPYGFTISSVASTTRPTILRGRSAGACLPQRRRDNFPLRQKWTNTTTRILQRTKDTAMDVRAGRFRLRQ